MQQACTSMKRSSNGVATARVNHAGALIFFSTLIPGQLPSADDARSISVFPDEKSIRAPRKSKRTASAGRAVLRPAQLESKQVGRAVPARSSSAFAQKILADLRDFWI